MDIGSYFGNLCQANTSAEDDYLGLRLEYQAARTFGIKVWVDGGIADERAALAQQQTASGERNRNFNAKLWQAELERVADVRVQAEPADTLSAAVQGMLGAGMSAGQLREAIARAAVAARGDFARTG